MSRGASLEQDHSETPPEQRFAELRQELSELLGRSYWDVNAMPQIYEALDVKCCRMAATCQRLIGIR
jgi:hypothetical protein